MAVHLRLIALVLAAYLVSGVACGPGTTPNIQELFTGRCWEYIEITSKRLVKPTKLDCDELWDTFLTGFAHKLPKDIRRVDYQPFFDEAKQTIPANTTLLWSGTFDIAHRYGSSGIRYLTMEDSLIGYLANGLRWCGRVCESCDGVNYVECPNFDELPPEASQAFWGGASTTFAGASRGLVKLMLSGSNPARKAYLRSSFFSQFELRSLTKDKMHLVIVLANEIGKPPLEHCGTGSLVLLQEDLDKYGINYSCVENPPDVLHLMCVDHAKAAECKMSEEEEPFVNKINKLSDILLRHRDFVA